MFIDMTEVEFEEMLNSKETFEIINWFKEQDALFNEPKLPSIEPGVYRRKFGMDMIEYDHAANEWEPFNPVIQGTDIIWATGQNKSCVWIKVLDTNYRPVMHGMEIAFNNSGKRVG